MPHDAALFVESVKQRLSPAETAARIEDEVEDARVQYKQSADSSEEQYRYLTTGVMPDQTPELDGFSPDGKPAAGVAFLVTVQGSSFNATSKINWDGSLITTTYVSPTSLTATVTPPATAQGVPVFVVNGDLTSVVKNYHFTAPAKAAADKAKPKAK
jgi:hypothetical protein